MVKNLNIFASATRDYLLTLNTYKFLEMVSIGLIKIDGRSMGSIDGIMNMVPRLFLELLSGVQLLTSYKVEVWT